MGGKEDQGKGRVRPNGGEEKRMSSTRRMFKSSAAPPQENASRRRIIKDDPEKGKTERVGGKKGLSASHCPEVSSYPEVFKRC